MTNKTNNIAIDFNATDLPFDMGTEKSSSSKKFDKPATRWLNINFILRNGDKVRKLALPFGLILDSLEERLAEGISEGKLSKREIADQQLLLKVLDEAFKQIPAGSSKMIELEGRLSKPSTVEDDVEIEEDEWSL